MFRRFPLLRFSCKKYSIPFFAYVHTNALTRLLLYTPKVKTKKGEI